MRATDSGKLYPRAALQFAQAHPEHPLAPQVLALVVAYSRYLTGGEDTKAAFRFLHAKWPKSKWAEQSPMYW